MLTTGILERMINNLFFRLNRKKKRKSEFDLRITQDIQSSIVSDFKTTDM